MKKFLAMLLVALSVVSCSACSKKSQVVDAQAPTPDASDASAPPVPVTVTFSIENFEVTLPGPGWKAQTLDPHIFKAGGAVPLLNETLQNACILAREETTSTSDAYVITGVRAIKNAGANVNATKQVDLNGHKFVLIESSKDNLRVWTWIALEKGLGYNFSCGGPMDKTNQQDLCLGIGNTLKIN